MLCAAAFVKGKALSDAAVLGRGDRLTGVLFPVRADQVRTNGPLLSGWARVVGERGRFAAAAWERVAVGGPNDGLRYLALTLKPIGADGRPVNVCGELHAATKRPSHASPAYRGFLVWPLPGDARFVIGGWDKRLGGERETCLALKIWAAEPGLGRCAPGKQPDEAEQQSSETGNGKER